MGKKTKIDWCDSQRKKILTKQGYVLVWNPNHPNANKGKGKGYIFEHRLVMSEHLGRALEKNEVVHHKNGNKSDNRIENLELLTNEEHMRKHGYSMTEKRKDAFVASVDGYLRATRIKNTEEGITEFTVADESITPSVEYRGEIQGEGIITYDNLGKAKVNIWNGKYCAVKSYQDSSVQLVSDVDNYEACMRR